MSNPNGLGFRAFSGTAGRGKEHMWRPRRRGLDAIAIARNLPSRDLANPQLESSESQRRRQQNSHRQASSLIPPSFLLRFMSQHATLFLLLLHNDKVWRNFQFEVLLSCPYLSGSLCRARVRGAPLACQRKTHTCAPPGPVILAVRQLGCTASTTATSE